MTNRSDLIVQYFNYLISEYGYQIAEKEFNPDAMGNAYVIFMSSKIGIEVTIDRNNVFIAIGEHSHPRREWFEFSDVIKYFAPSIKNVYDFPEKTEEQSWDSIVEIQLNNLATMLHRYCKPLLGGEIWLNDEFKNNEEKRLVEILSRLKKKS